MKNEHVINAYIQCNYKIKTKHVFMEKGVLYSYGYHFPIALKLEGGLYLFNSDGYSNTTARHKGLLKRAVGEDRLIMVNTEKLKKAIEQEIKTKEQFIESQI